MIKHVLFIGLGLIGGSLARKVRYYHPRITISAIASSQATIRYALKEHIIDGTGNLRELAKEADLIIVATPIDLISKMVRDCALSCKPNAIIIDIGSTKEKICHELRAYQDLFIGGHPMFGTEHTGIKNSALGLGDNALFALTPYKKTPPAKLKKLTHFLHSLQFRTNCVSPLEHDHAVAAISHTPYFTAAALVQTATTLASKKLAATGFQSTTRIASSDPAWGVSIAQTNAPHICKQIEHLQSELATINTLIIKQDWKKLERYLAKSAHLRAEIYPS